MSNTSGFTITEWTAESIPKLLELTRMTLGTSAAVSKTEAFWQWKHQQSPFGRSYGIVACENENDRIAALRILLRWQFISQNGDTIQAARAVDTATHPDYQRQGLFTALTKRAISDLREEGASLIYNTPNEKSLPGYLKMGWRLVDKRPLYIKPLRPMRMLRRRLQPVNHDMVNKPDSFFDSNVVLSWRRFIEMYGDQAWSLIEKWERLRTQTGWRTVRSADYYRWRYGHNPNTTYFVQTLTDTITGTDAAIGTAGSELVGFAVMRPNVRFGWQEVVLSDMIIAEPDPTIGRQLLRELVRNTRADYVIAHFAPGTVEYDSIRRSGFLRAAGQGMRFTVRPLVDDLRQITQPDDWDLSLGDLEVF